MEFRLAGGGYTGPRMIKQRGAGAGSLILRGSVMIRVHGVGSAYLGFKLSHNHTDSIVVVNSNGAESGSWFSVERVN